MADLSKTFIEFNDIIYLTNDKKTDLRKSRAVIREDIVKYFNEKRDKHTVKFKGQGSLSMNTCILPLSGEYDVDDGVYIFGKEEDKPTVATAHSWICDALNGKKIIDKNTCIRVICDNEYHVDLPIYYKTDKKENEFFWDDKDVPELAHKSKGWIESDPYEFKKWFEGKAKDKPQLKRIVRYLKAWSDNKSHLNLPSGMVFTILAANNYVVKDRDDEALLETLKAIQQNIDDTRFILASYVCKRPTVDKRENLLAKYSADTRKKNFLDELNGFIESGKKALELKSKKDACAKWQKHLGERRFPCSNVVEDDETLAKAFSHQDVLRYDNKSA
ncbi:CBASS cGAMP synthase [Flavobacterium sp. ST-75]|uniref:Cyclic GMP-AMP synthase n=1 Tax=Flavobacterium rhizophilum TaxID=3163296 RepID=A0ABW8YAW2_9FLAO